MLIESEADLVRDLEKKRRWLQNLTSEPEIAEEALNETYINVARQLEKRGGTYNSGYTQVALKRCCNHMAWARHREVLTCKFSENVDSEISEIRPDAQAHARDRLEKVRGHRWFKCALDAALYGNSVAAKKQGITPGALAVRVHRFRQECGHLVGWCGAKNKL